MKSKLAAILTLVMLIAVIGPVPVKADSVTYPIEVQCGTNVKGVIDALGTLTVSGTGAMYDVAELKSPFEQYGRLINRIVIQSGVTTVGSYMFYGVGNIDKYTSIDIADTVTSIGDYAFAWQWNLPDVTIPASVRTIGVGAFYDSNIKNLTLHEGLVTIGEKAFYKTSLTDVTIPSTVTSVDSGAFASISRLQVTIPQGVGVIRASAFDDYTSADIYSVDVVLAVGAFGRGSVLTADRGSTADAYAQNDSGVTIHYRQYPVSISFDAQGGSVEPAEKTVYTEAAIGLLPLPQRKGYAFSGWYNAEGELVTTDTVVISREPITLYAHWKKVSVAKGNKPTLKSKKAGQLTVSYKKVAGAKGYQIRYSRKSNMKSAKTIGLTGKSKTIKSLKKGAVYYVQVRAYKYDSTISRVYGAWSKKAKLKVRKK